MNGKKRNNQREKKKALSEREVSQMVMTTEGR